MKNVNVFGVHGKIRFLGEGGRGLRKTNIYGGDCLKKGGWTVCRFKGRLGNIEEGVMKPQCTLWSPHSGSAAIW